MLPSHDPRGWWVVRVLCGSEFEIGGDMLADGLDVFVPSYTVERRNRYQRNKKTRSTLPLFPGYLFLRPDPTFRPAKFETRRTTVRVLRGSSGRVLVTEAQMAVVREAEAEASRPPAEHKIQPGDLVRLLRGVLKGESAQVLRTRGRTAFVSLGRRDIVVNISDLEGISGVASR